MKTYILQLDPYDDLISVRDKMGWAKDSRILIVWPDKGEVINRRLDLVLIKRQAQRFGTQIAFVSNNQDVRYHGPRLGIKVFRSIRSAQSQPWRVPHRFRGDLPSEIIIDRHLPRERAAGVSPERWVKERREPPFLSRIVFFAIGVLAVLVLGAVLAPSAHVLLQPKILVQDVIIRAFTEPEIKDINIAGSVPSEVVELDVEGRDSQSVSGSAIFPYQPAEGTAVFSNLTDEPVVIPEGTVVRANAIPGWRFATIRKNLVPAGSGQTAEVEVRCLTPGEAGNLPASSLTSVEGLLATRLSVSNPKAFFGGSDRTEPAPTQEDREKLAARLESALKETALQEIQRQLADGDLLLSSSLKPVQTIEKTYQPEGRLPAEILYLHARIKFQARIVRAANLEEMSEMVFDANLPPGYKSVPGSLHLEVVEGPEEMGANRFSWSLHAIRRVEAQISSSQVIQISLGLKPEEATNRLESALPLEEPPTILIQPDWWPRFPVLPFRIQVINKIVEGNLRKFDPAPRSGKIFTFPTSRFWTIHSWFNSKRNAQGS